MSLEKSQIGNTGLRSSSSKFDRFSRQTSIEGLPYDRLILTEEEKEREDYYVIKQLVNAYENMGRRQIFANKDKIIRNMNRANGVLDKKDLADVQEELSMVDQNSDDFEIESYPLIPRIVNTITSFRSKIAIEHQVIAVNREAQNEILDLKNQEIVNLLINKARQFYVNDLANQGVTQETTPDLFQEQMDIFQKLPKIQSYYNQKFRLSVEKWASIKMESAKRKFQFPSLERKLLRNKVICDRPYLHLNLRDDVVVPEVLRPENCAYLRSPNKDCVSHGHMFMWYEYENATSIIQSFGDKLREEDIEKLRQRFLPTQFTATTAENYDFSTRKPIEADIQNFFAFRNERDTFDRKYRGEEYRDNLIEVLNMYLQIPRKLIEVTIITDNGKTVEIVDETYKPMFKPTYITGKPKTKENLISGEHVEPFYINELYRVKKINFSRNTNPELSEDIWVVLEKFPVQISDPKVSRYGSLIPVHGGPMTNSYSATSEIVDKALTWETLFQYLWNRINQILQTEIGQFFLLNQNTIPSESIGGSWGKNNIVKFLLTARDTGIGPVDLSPSNIGSANQITNGYGQKVDMSRGEELLQKIELAEAVKRECLNVIGVSPQFLSDISPNESATGILQGIQRSITSIKHIYDEHFALMERGWQTYLELERYVAAVKGSVEETFINSENERVIFQTSAQDFPLYSLGVFTTSSFDDSLLLAEIQQMVKTDNTLGADVAEKVAMLTSKSVSQTLENLKELQRKKQQAIEEQQKSQEALLQKELESKERMKMQELEWEREKLLLELESAENIQEMRVVGQSTFAQGGGVEELAKLKDMELKERSYYQSILDKIRESSYKDQELETRYNETRTGREEQASLKQKELDLKREEIAAKLQIANKQIEIAKENKNKFDKKTK
jgi:hypothetical protein